MSSFRRRATTSSLPGTRPSPSGASLLSTGLPAIDDLLGGGLPLSSNLLVLQDHPTAYSDLVLRYWVAQGLECGHDVAVVAAAVDGGPEAVAEGLMGTEGAEVKKDDGRKTAEEREDDLEREQEEALKDKMKIAFRYEGLGQHQTTLKEASPSKAGETDTFSSLFDLTTTRALSSADRKLLHLVDVDELLSSSVSTSAGPYSALYEQIEKLVDEGGFRIPSDPAAPRKVLRIAISNFGSPSWGAASPAALYSFLLRLRHLSFTSHLSTLLTFPSHLFSPSSSSSSQLNPLTTRLAHAVHSVLSLSSLSGSPAAALFPRHSGLLSFPKLPLAPPSRPSSLVPPGSKLSVLRQLGGGGEGRDNLVGFRVKRRRFVVEVVSEDPGAGGEDEEERRRRERRRRVEEANRKEREMASQEGREMEGEKATDVLLRKVGERVAQVRIGGEEHQHEHGGEPCGHDHSHAVEDGPPPALAPPAATGPKKSAFRKKSARIGGVSFAGAGADGGGKEEKPSAAKLLHTRPELLDF
ncbi:hypothetical protein JCM8097_005715 [Rhodosporidiobolus ruineniae]